MIFHENLVIENDNFSVTYFNRERPSKVVISVPHDGLIQEDFSTLFTSRSCGFKGRDTYVWPVVNSILLRALEAGTTIDAVRLLMPRAFVDGNREAAGDLNVDPETLGQIAFEDPKVASVYRHYHDEIAHLLRRSVGAHGKESVLFIDMHGFGKQPSFAPEGGYDLILGTANRATIPYGAIDKVFAAFMTAKGYKVFLPSETPVSPHGDPYSAGHTTRFYAKEFGVNAIQIEIDSKFRQLEAREKGKRLSSDLAEFFVRI